MKDIDDFDFDDLKFTRNSDFINELLSLFNKHFGTEMYLPAQAEITFCPIHSVLFSLLDELSMGNLPKHIVFDDYGHFNAETFGKTTRNFASLLKYYRFFFLLPRAAEGQTLPTLTDQSKQAQKLLYEQYQTDDDFRWLLAQYDIVPFEKALWKYLNEHYTFENGSFKRYRKLN